MRRYIRTEYYYGGDKNLAPKPIVLCLDDISVVLEDQGATMVLLTNGLSYLCKCTQENMAHAVSTGTLMEKIQ